MFVYAGDVLRSPGGKFKSNASDAAEHVEDRHIFKIKIIIQDIEEPCFSKIGGGPHRKVAGCCEVSTFKCSAYDSHRIWLKTE